MLTSHEMYLDMIEKVMDRARREETPRAASFTDIATAMALIPDGAHLAISKIEPMAAVRALVAMGRHDLHLIAVPTAGFAADLLVAAGLVRVIETGAVLLQEHGAAPAVMRALAEGRVQRIESACPLLELQIQAGALGLPFVPVPGLEGSDVLVARPDLSVVASPFSGDAVVLAPALRPDVTLIHALRADLDGNIVVSSLAEDHLLARAARMCIATVESVCADALASLSADERVVPAFFVSALVEAPLGTWPLALPGVRDADAQGIATHLAASARAAENPFLPFAAPTRPAPDFHYSAKRTSDR